MKNKKLLFCLSACLLTGLVSCDPNPTPEPSPTPGPTDKFEFSFTGVNVEGKLQSETEGAWKGFHTENDIAKDSVYKFDLKTSYDYGWQLPATLSINGYNSSDYTYTLDASKKTAKLEITMKANVVVTVTAEGLEERITTGAQIESITEYFSDSDYPDSVQGELLDWKIWKHGGGEPSAETVQKICNMLFYDDNKGIIKSIVPANYHEIASSKPTGDVTIEATAFGIVFRSKESFIDRYCETESKDVKSNYTISICGNDITVLGDILTYRITQPITISYDFDLTLKFRRNGSISYHKYSFEDFNFGEENADGYVEASFEDFLD